MCRVGSIRVFVSAALYTVPWNETEINDKEVNATAYGMGLEEKVVQYLLILPCQVM
jgi:hypothetical protein